MDRFHSADIDEEVDLVIAETFVKRLGLDAFGNDVAKSEIPQTIRKANG